MKESDLTVCNRKLVQARATIETLKRQCATYGEELEAVRNLLWKIIDIVDPAKED